jgi:hypothetical protein
MAFALLFIGIVMVVSAVMNTQDNLTNLIQGDFSGPGNFFYWIIALIAVGSIGYSEKLKPLSDGLLIVILVGLVLSKGNPNNNPGGGFFNQFVAALKSTNVPAVATPTGTPGNAYTGSGSGGVSVSTPGGGVSVGSGGVAVTPPSGTINVGGISIHY